MFTWLQQCVVRQIQLLALANDLTVVFLYKQLQYKQIQSQDILVLMTTPMEIKLCTLTALHPSSSDKFLLVCLGNRRTCIEEK